MPLPSVLDYARYHELAVDPRSDLPLAHMNSYPIPSFDHDQHLREVLAPGYEELLREEKLQLSHDAVKILLEWVKPPPTPDWTQVLNDHRSIGKLKVEVPMLVSDHDKDMKWFKKGIDLQKLIQTWKPCPESEQDNFYASADDLTDCEQLSLEIHTEASGERLQASLVVMQMLAACTLDDWTQQLEEEIVAQDLKPSKTHCISPLTPALVPQSPNDSPYPDLAPVPGFELDPRSDIEVDADDLLLRLERAAKTEDQICTSDVEDVSASKVRAILGQGSRTHPLDTTLEWPSLSSSDHPSRPDVSLEDLKIEVSMVPLPADSAEKPKTSKWVALKDVFEEFIDFPSDVDFALAEKAKNEDDEDKKLFHSLEQYNEDMKQGIKAEKLTVNDKALQVVVPRLPLVTINNPHKLVQEVSSAIDLLRDKTVDRIKTTPVDEKKLNWIPIPRQLMHIDLKEAVEYTRFPHKLIEKPERVLRSEQLLYREPGLRILDIDQDDDDEIDENSELSKPPTSQQAVSQVPRKRSAMQLDDHRPGDRTLTSHARGALSPNTNRLRYIHPTNPQSARALDKLPNQHDRRQDLKSSNTADLYSDQVDMDELPEPIVKTKLRKIGSTVSKREFERSIDSFSAASSLTSFLNLKGGKFKKPDLPNSPYKCRDNDPHVQRFGEKEHDPIHVSQTQTHQTRPDTHHLLRSGSLRQSREHIEVSSTPNGESKPEGIMILPAMAHLDERRTIVVDTALAYNRQLMALLETQGKQRLTVIYRELHGLPDIILNPSTCFLFTNIQALTQKSLPGQKPKMGQTTPQEKISHLAARYMSIFVLVSAPSNATGPSDSIQMSAMSEFCSFCASFKAGSLSAEITPVWSAAEDINSQSWTESSLRRWTWSLIRQHAFRNSMVPCNPDALPHLLVLIEEEILWEQFLRKAGVNALATQIILGLFKNPAHVDPSSADMEQKDVSSNSERSWGLGRLVSMTAAERLKLFGDIVGEQAVERMNRVLDQ